jgi:putative membrane protein
MNSNRLTSNHQSLSATVCAFVGILCMATAAAPAAEMGSLSPVDRAFMMKASEGNVGEIASGKLAENNAGSTTVRLLGKRYVDNHRTNEEHLSLLAAEYGVTLPKHPTAADLAQAHQLSMLQGRAFDAAFLRGEQQDHIKTIAMFKREIRDGSNPLVVAYAKKSLPVLEEHLLLATDDASRMHVTAPSGQ